MEKGRLPGALPFLFPARGRLFCLEGFTVHAGASAGVFFVGPHTDGIQGAVVILCTMICALLNGAADAGIGFFFVHVHQLLSRF